MLKITCNSRQFSAKQYILDVVFAHFLGLDYEINLNDSLNKIIIEYANNRLSFSDVLLLTPDDDWLTNKSLPESKLDMFELSKVGIKRNKINQTSLPIIYGRGVDFSEIDLFGSIFFMLSRYEESVINKKDKHGRFLSKDSIAFKNNFLSRPIVNEYLELLSALLEKQLGVITPKHRQFSILPSHDVDHAYKYLYTKKGALLKNLAKEILSKKSVVGALRELTEWSKIKMGKMQDPYDLYHYIEAINNRYGLNSTYYFMVNSSSYFKDCHYSIFHPGIVELIEGLAKKGNKIGLHTSFKTHNNPKLMHYEVERFNAIRHRLKLNMMTTKVRQHYLRLDIDLTFNHQELAGVNEDASLGYADHAGFRSGVCYSYPLYSLSKRMKLNVIEQPLILMDVSLLNPYYMNLSVESAYDYALLLKDRCRQYQGDFSVLWHNSSLTTLQEQALYLAIVSAYSV